MTPQAPRELWPNTTPHLMAHLRDDGASRNAPIVGWARYHDARTVITTVEPVIMEPISERYLIFARECDAFQYVVDTRSQDHAADVVKKLDAIVAELSAIKSRMPM